LQRAVSNIEFLNSEIIIVKATEQELPPVSARIDLRVIHDIVTGKGPLAGILIPYCLSYKKRTIFQKLMTADLWCY